MEEDLPETFDVEERRQTTDWASYRSFISSLRNRLGDTSSHNLPVLPPQENPPTRWFQIVLRTNSHNITLMIRRDNLYLDGYQTENNQWFEFNAGGPQLIPGSILLPLYGGYPDLQRVAGAGRGTIFLGQEQLIAAVNSLATTDNNQQRAHDLIVVIQMISESIRFTRISNHLSSQFGTGAAPPDWMLELENSWGDISTALLRLDADPLYHFPQPNDMGIETVDQAVEITGILLRSCFGPGPSGRVPRMADEQYCFLGRPMVEVFSVLIDNIDGEDPGDLYGKITVADGLGRQLIYNQDREHYQKVSPGDNALLTGPAARAISAYGNFTIEFALMDRDADPTPDDETSNGIISWNVFHTNNVYDKVFFDHIDGEYGSASVSYVVLSNAVQASIVVRFINGDGENPADVYGSITARNSNFTNESVLFYKKAKDYIQVGPREAIPLSRSIVAVPLNSSLIVNAKLSDQDSIPFDDEIANGSAEFVAQSSGVTSESISEKYGEVKVTVTWDV